jgi:hypothetical protein
MAQKKLEKIVPLAHRMLVVCQEKSVFQASAYSLPVLQEQAAQQALVALALVLQTSKAVMTFQTIVVQRLARARKTN